MSKSSVIVVFALLLTGAVQDAQAASPYGCFRVTVDSLNVRARPYSSAGVLATASKGEILEKRKLFCTLRGFWCAVRKGTVEGYADTSLMTKINCP